jgi:uroporphyrinogen-III synthase
MISEGVRKALFFCGDQRLDVLPDNLRNNGVELNEVIVYTTLLKPVKLKEAPEIILFFSPTAVKSFFSMNEISTGTTLIAMGTTTAAALKKYTEHPVIVSPEADKVYVINMALEYAASHPII